MMILDILARYVHVVSALLMLGAMSAVIFCVWPATRLLDEGLRSSLHQLVQNRLGRIFWIAAAGLIVSGVYNWIKLAAVYRDMGPLGNALIGTKVLLAAILLALYWARQTRLLQKGSDRSWLMIYLHLGAIILLLAAVLRYFRLEHLNSLLK
ncbi:MAG: hypothetical protein IT443_07680 [Phycisphaeraceae bacterium]|nr:hypothetical protein [Phycisphaeraceae bacterium]